MESAQSRTTQVLKLADVMKRTSLGRSTIFRLVNKGNFPKPQRLSPGRTGWFESDVNGWLDALRFNNDDTSASHQAPPPSISLKKRGRPTNKELAERRARAAARMEGGAA